MHSGRRGGAALAGEQTAGTDLDRLQEWVDELLALPNEADGPVDRWQVAIDMWTREAAVCYASASLGGALRPLIVQEQLLDDVYSARADLAECPTAARLMARICSGGVHRAPGVDGARVRDRLCDGCLGCSILLTGSEADELATWLEGRLGWEAATQCPFGGSTIQTLVQTVGAITLRWTGPGLLDPIIGRTAPSDTTHWRAAWRRLARRCPLVALAWLELACGRRDESKAVPGPVAPWEALWRRDVLMLLVDDCRGVRLGAAAILPRLGLAS